MADLTTEGRDAVGNASALLALWRTDDGEDPATDLLVALSREDLEIVVAYLLTLVTAFVDDDSIAGLALLAQAEADE